MPVTIPAKSLEGVSNPDEVLEKLSKGQVHEALYTLLLIQSIEAMIATQENNAI